MLMSFMTAFAMGVKGWPASRGSVCANCGRSRASCLETEGGHGFGGCLVICRVRSGEFKIFKC